MKSIFDGFKLDPGKEISDYERVTIALQTDYMDGSGWNAAQRHRFKSEVYPALEKAGYSIKNLGDKWGPCPDLVSPSPSNKLCLYMHPQAFTGYGRMDDIDRIIDVLQECKSVYDVRLHYHEPVYDISDYQYKDMILSRSDEIIKCLQDAVVRGDYLHPSDIGFEFARNNRIPRIGDGSGISFSDTDVQVIRDIYLIAEKQGLLDKDFIKAQQAKGDFEEKAGDLKQFMNHAIKEGVAKFDLSVFTTNELGQLIDDISGYRTEMGQLSDNKNVNDLYEQTYALLRERQTKSYDSSLYICQLSEGEQRTLENAIVDVLREQFGVSDITAEVDDGQKTTIEDILENAMAGKLTDLSDTLDWRAALKGDDYSLDRDKVEERE